MVEERSNAWVQDMMPPVIEAWACPECGYCGTPPVAPWHAADCEGPEPIRVIYALAGPRELGRRA